MCLIGVKETYVQEKKKVTKNFLGQICTTVSGLKWIFKKTRYKKLVTHVEPHVSAMSLLKRAENSAI